MMNRTHTLMVALAVAVVLSLGATAQAYVMYSTSSTGNWSEATWTPTGAPTEGPGAGDGATVNSTLTYDAGASGGISKLVVSTGNVLNVERDLDAGYYDQPPYSSIKWVGATLNIDNADVTASWYAQPGTLNATNGASFYSIDRFQVVSDSSFNLEDTSTFSTGGTVQFNAGVTLDITGAAVTFGGNITGSAADVNVTQNAGQLTGMTLDGSRGSATFNLTFDAGSTTGDWDWIFRLNEATDSVTGLIGLGDITVSGAPYEVVNNGSYTYIQAIPVPEPATMSLLALGGISALVRRRRR